VGSPFDWSRSWETCLTLLASLFLSGEKDVFDRALRLADCLTNDLLLILVPRQQKAESIDQIPPSVGDEESRKRALILRRSMLLAVAGGTPPDSASLSQALASGYLEAVKRWLADVLDGSIGTFCKHLFS
jgi:hypothetical protein